MRTTLIIVALALIMPVEGIFAQDISPTHTSTQEVEPTTEAENPKKKTRKKKLSAEELNQQFFDAVAAGDQESVAASLDAMKY